MAEVSLQPNEGTRAFKEMAAKWAKRWNESVDRAHSALWDTEPMKTGPLPRFRFFERQWGQFFWYHEAYETQIGMD